MRLQGQTAIITGSGRGIGQDIALAFAREGARVVVSDIDPVTTKQSAELVQKHGTASGIQADVTKRADVERLVEKALSSYGRIDILVNNAMRIVPGRLEELSDEAWDATINIGLKGSFLMTQTVGRHMIANKAGCVINIASIAGLSPYNFAGSYSTVKAGIIMLTKQVALEWGQYGIRCNAIAPGFIHTPGTDGMYSNAEIKKGREAFTPLGRIGTGEDVAKLAVFLATPEASYTTGSVIETDGGQNVGLYMAVPGRSFSGGALK